MRRTVLFVALALPAPALAQSAEPSESIVVTGEGLPLPPGTPAYGSVLIDRSRLVNNASGRIENVLADVAGFQQFRRSDSRSANPSAQGATLRALGGNASSRALVVLDGVPMADPFFGYIPFSALVPDRLSVVRVTRGGGAGAFGAGAVAGTIELVSAARRDLPGLFGSAFYGSRDSTEISGGVIQDLGGGFVSLTGRWDRGDGFQTTPKDQRTAATVPAAYDGWSAGLRAVAPLGPDMELQFRGLVFRDDRTLRFAGADNSSEGQDASIRLVSRGAWQVDALAYVQARNFSNIVINVSGEKTLDQRNTPSTGLGGKIEMRPPVGKGHVLRVGVDTRFSNGDMYEDAFVAATGITRELRQAGGSQRTAGIFLEDDWTIGALMLTGGVRADRWTITNGFYNTRTVVTNTIDRQVFANRKDWETSFRTGALLQVSENVAFRTAAYTNFRLPTLNELYRRFSVPTRDGVVITEANAALKPEKLRGVEAGIDLTPFPGAALSITGFHNRLGDAIANTTPDPDNAPNVRLRDNVKAIVAKGVEVTAQAKLADFLLSASYAYSHNRVRAPGELFDGLTPAQSPRHAASATLAWEPRSGPALSVTLRYVAKQFEDDLETDILPDALTMDAVARVPLGRGVTLVGRGENLFDAKVVTRNVRGSMDLGTPRTLWIGVRFER